MSELYCDITNTTKIMSVNISNNHDNSCSQAVFTTKSTTLDIGDLVTIDMGYTDHHHQLFKGYVKQKEQKVPDGTYTITAFDKMIRAMDYFIVSSNPDAPWKTNHVEAKTLVQDIMALAGLTSFHGTNTNFILGINTDVEVNLVSAYDFCKMIADLVTWSLWADQNGQIHFENRKPFVMYDSVYTGKGQANYAVDSSPTTPTLTDKDFLDFTYKRSEKDLRNKMQVYGVTGVSASASKATSLDPTLGPPYSGSSFIQVLPTGFYKTAAVATPIIDSNGVAQDCADYNLLLMNRLQVSAVCTIVGNPDFECRQIASIDESVTGITGWWYIYGLNHDWSKSGYTTYCELRR